MGKTLSRSPRCRLSTSEISVHGRTFVSYERSVTFHIIGITRRDRISLVNLSKSFLANRDNFCIYEQALSLRPACFIRRISVASNAVQTIQILKLNEVYLIISLSIVLIARHDQNSTYKTGLNCSVWCLKCSDILKFAEPRRIELIYKCHCRLVIITWKVFAIVLEFW